MTSRIFNVLHEESSDVKKFKRKTCLTVENDNMVCFKLAVLQHGVHD